jgi:cytochrome c553
VHPIVKWATAVLAVLSGLVLLAVAYVYGASTMMIARRWPMPPQTFHVARGASPVEGRHLAAVLGCTDCHGPNLEGQLLDFVPNSSLYAPNLVFLAKSLSNSDLERAIRHAQKPDGSSIVVMPSNQYANLNDAEVSSLIAYIRSLHGTAPMTPDPSYGLFARAGLILGMFSTEKSARETYKFEEPLDLGPTLAAGRHMAMVACGECHRSDLTGVKEGDFQTPDLMVAAAYDRADFLHFMKTGSAAGGRELGLMSQTARHRFSHFTDSEANAVYDYLAARGQKLAGK